MSISSLQGLDPSICPSVTCHAWNADKTQVAIAPNTNELWIYSCPSKDPKSWKREHVLNEHAGLISGVDWSPVTNMIVTCSHDRNAYVWKFDQPSNQWKPTLVILRINRAATSVHWSPSGAKFAVGSGAKCVPVCHFEPSNDWWISKMIKKHKSTVTSLAWSPNSAFLVTGSTDLKVRLFSAFLEGTDDEAACEEFKMFGSRANDSLIEFGSCLGEFDSGHAWIHSVAWSPNGATVAAASHASIVTFISLTNGGEPAAQQVWSKALPLLDIVFITDNVLVGSGFDGALHIYNKGADGWAFKERLTTQLKPGSAASTPKVGAGISSARAMFAAAADRGQSSVFGGGAAASTKSDSRHLNAVCNLLYLPATKQVSTAGLDGKICFWDISTYL